MKIKGKRLLEERQEFIPEKEIKLLSYNNKLWKKIFPEKKGVNLKNYQLTNIGYYSIILPKDSERIADIIKSYFNSNIVVTDATSNMGGVVMKLSDYFKVNAVEINDKHFEILKNNYLDLIDELSQDVVFFDPPWGGTDYRKEQFIDLKLDNISISKIVEYILENKLAKLIVVRVPINYKIRKLVKLVEKSEIYSFYKDNKINYFLIVLSC
jgi:predicted RNA methylase